MMVIYPKRGHNFRLKIFRGGWTWKCKLFHPEMWDVVRRAGSQEMITIQASLLKSCWTIHNFIPFWCTSVVEELLARLFTLLYMLYCFDILLFWCITAHSVWLVGLLGSDYPQNKTTGPLPPIYISIHHKFISTSQHELCQKYVSNVHTSIHIFHRSSRYQKNRWNQALNHFFFVRQCWKKLCW